MLLPVHSGETCVILGNGPSLADVPRAFLNSAPSFGCNYIGRLPFQPRYYVCIDSNVLNHHAAEIRESVAGAEMAFLSNADYVKDNPDLAKLRALPNVTLVGRSAYVFDGEMFMSGFTAVYVALKIAFFMGFTRALLVGVDHTQDFQHFSPDYPAGNPNLAGMRYHFNLANIIYSENGREIINLSPHSPLDAIFRRGEFIKQE
jgi:hypothetical protein